MGNGSSKVDTQGSPSSSSSDGQKENAAAPKARQSRRRRIRNKLHRHRGTSSQATTSHVKLVTAENFAGIALVQIIRAEMKFKDRWMACISLGERTFRTSKSDQTDKPEWNTEKKLLLDTDGPSIARISVFETNRVSKNNLVGYCEIDLVESIGRGELEVLDLLDPSSKTVVGRIYFSCSIEDPIDTERSFARRILSIVDHDQDGKLSFSEFSELVDAFGNQVAASKKKELFNRADKDDDGSVSMDELANLIAIQQEKESLISNCPVCGETLGTFDKLNDMIHMTLCFDEGTGNQVMTGGFLTDKQASYGWIFKLSEWAHFSSYDIGLKSGSSASNIVVFDRKSKRLIEELISGKVMLSIRAIYQSKVGLCLIDKGAKDLLKNLSEKQGKRMNSAESVCDIPKFIESFKDQINTDEMKHPISHYKTFNEFFIRELKPDARPIASKEHGDVAICAADSRLMAFKSADDSLRFWIKGRKFSINGLLGSETSSSDFLQGSLVIFRLAPQDYHRFHAPVSGRIESFLSIPGSLYTVNPVAVNSKYCNVFTENKRVVAVISTEHFGKVALVAVGATMVGSITFTKEKGQYVQKGEELGYFSFGGSTVICVFEKDKIDLDKDLLANSARPLETLVSVGMTLGVSRKREIEIVLSSMEGCTTKE